MRKKRNSSSKKSNLLKIVLIIIIFLIIGALVFFNSSVKKQDNIKEEKIDISVYYNEFVKTNKETKIYIQENEEYKKIGIIASGVELTLNELTKAQDQYFNIKDFDAKYYISYLDVDKLDELTTQNQRYKKYITFDSNIKTENETNFYNEEGNLIYSFEEGYSLPIIIKEDDMYGIEFNNQLLYIKKGEGIEVENNNTTEQNTKSIGVLNYHFFYDETDVEDTQKCNQVICSSKKQFKEHLDYIKENNIFTPTMKELEMYIDNKIQLPKSVVITIDDGWRSKIAIEILNEYQLNGTLFLITSDYEPKNYKNEYVELHSHTDNLHTQGQCPGGQGGGIKCLPQEEILADLKTSREKLSGSTVLCYPFYEYNDYSIKLVKEAGFTMAFAGGNNKSVQVGSDKFRLPRFVVVNYTTIDDIANYLN